MEDSIHTQTVATVAIAAFGGFAAGSAFSLVGGALATFLIAVAALYAIAPSTETVAVTWLKESEGMDPSAAEMEGNSDT